MARFTDWLTGSFIDHATPYVRPWVSSFAASSNSCQLQGCPTLGTRTPDLARSVRLAMSMRGSWRNGTP